MSSQEKYYPSIWDAVLVWVVIACKVFVLISGSDVKPKLRMNGGNISMLLKLDYLSLYPEMTKLVSSWQHVHYLVIRVQKCHTRRGLNYSRDTETEQFRGSLKYWQYVIFHAYFLCIFVFLHPHWSCVKLRYYWSMIHAWAWFITNSLWVRYWKAFCTLPAWFSFSPWKKFT